MNKKIIIAISFILISSSVYTQAGFYSGGHDSLLFDGGNISSTTADNPYECRLSVEKVKGSVIGTRKLDKPGNICTGFERYTEYKKEQIKEGDFLKPGDEITTGPDGDAIITLIDGKEIYIYPNTTFTVGSSDKYCRNEDIPVSVKKGGMLLIDARKGDRNKVLEISTDRSKVYVKGTVFTVLTQDGGENIDIIKTYEGVVEVYVTNKNSSSVTNFADEITKLNNDYQNKLITLDEYTRKMTELTSKNEKNIEEVTKIKIDLSAGFKCTIDSNGKISEPEAFDTNDDTNFKK